MSDTDREKYYEQYNFGDIDLGDETAEGNYDFGNTDDEQVESIVNKGQYDFNNAENFGEYIIKLFTDALRDILIDGTVYLRRKELVENPTRTGIILQYYFTPERVFIEFDFDDSFKEKFDYRAVTLMLHRYIHHNFKYDTGIWPEVLLIEDSYTNIVDTYLNINPYVVGYWKSLSGKYQFITDKTKVMRDIQNRGDETFENFMNQVSKLRNTYSQTILSEDEKMKYFNDHTALVIKYKDDKERFVTELAKLNKKYKLKSNLNDMIPEIYEKYCKLYKKFFKINLPNYSIEEHTFKMYLEILNEKGEF